MPHGRENNRGYRSIPLRGGGRGGLGGRGTSRAGDHGAGIEYGEGTLVFEGDFQDFTLDHVFPPVYCSPVRGRGGSQTPPRGSQSAWRGGRGVRGISSAGSFTGPRIPLSTLERDRPLLRPVSFVRGIGFAGSFTGQRIPLSTLEKDRPLLRPVSFVRGEHQKTLFEKFEETLHIHENEDKPLEDHAPSADIVERIFHCEKVAEDVSASLDKISQSENHERIEISAEHTESSFIVDTIPSPTVLTSQTSGDMEPAPLGVLDEEIIVYAAPHPRTSRPDVPSSSPPSPAVKRLSNSPDIHLTMPVASSQPGFPAPTDAVPVSFNALPYPVTPVSNGFDARKNAGLKPTPRSQKMAKKAKKARAAARRREERQVSFSLTGVGLSMEERVTLQDKSTGRDDPRHAERRRGSDVEWGSDDESVIEVRNSIGDMELDGEVSDMAALTRFTRGVDRLGKEVVTIADLNDTDRMRDDDDEADSHEVASSRGDEGISDSKERKALADNADIDDSQSSDKDSPGQNFQARLRRLREEAQGRALSAVDPSPTEDDSEDEGLFGPGLSWADRDEKFLDGIGDLLDDDESLLRDDERRARKRLFKAIQSGDMGDAYETLNPFNMRKKDRHVPPSLHDQWEHDRKNKAERKRKRMLARIQAATNLSPKRKGKKKLFDTARIEGDRLYVERVDNLTSLEGQIRNFLSDLELNSLVLPPKGKDFRRRAHLLAKAFNLKSNSKGKGEGRFTTLTKTTRSGIGINERRISRLVNGKNTEGVHTSARAGKIGHHREGDAIGKSAPRLSGSNLGFKLLQQMGWEEGGRIGVNGGLADPLTAIIKTSKRGLGATR